jgi:hypothetical protein
VKVGSGVFLIFRCMVFGFGASSIATLEI